MTNRLFCAAFVLSLLAACSSGSGEVPSTSGGASSSSSGGGVTGGNNLNAVATTEAPAPPAGAKVALLWQVTSGSPDYLYSQSAGATQNDKASLALSTTPPVEALNSGKLGIAFVTVFDPAATVADGKVSNDTYETATLAISPDYAVIYRATTDSVVKKGWDASFPQGYACGKCQRAETGFDTFVVVDCSEIRLVPVSSKPKVCNWT